jgi:hypothetical protein
LFIRTLKMSVNDCMLHRDKKSVDRYCPALALALMRGGINDALVNLKIRRYGSIIFLHVFDS